MQLQSPAYNDKASIPVKYAMPGAGGENLSVPLTWTDPPEGTRSFALTMLDPHPVANNWIHWMVIDIPAETRKLEEGASGKQMPEGARELSNSFGKGGYGGPQPPAGTGEHPYVCTLYALSTESLDLDARASLADFEQAIQGKVLDKAEYTGIFEQQ
ncbi:MAG: YbhB/YbcL family Raf kinase inhibitor-like protein [Desulfohalobiaceae bacterium]|nr:YbhB/YbcL family Raf kinase inhibitor-like protein [Desulfohalobiaceae bacterium]